jgi:hypothetical protein
MVMALIKKTLAGKDGASWQSWMRQVLHQSEHFGSCERFLRERPSNRLPVRLNCLIPEESTYARILAYLYVNSGP